MLSRRACSASDQAPSRRSKQIAPNLSPSGRRSGLIRKLPSAAAGSAPHAHLRSVSCSGSRISFCGSVRKAPLSTPVFYKINKSVQGSAPRAWRIAPDLKILTGTMKNFHLFPPDASSFGRSVNFFIDLDEKHRTSIYKCL